MARRKSRKNVRRSPKTFNLGSLAESALIANAVTHGFFNADLGTFLFNTTGGEAGKGVSIDGMSTITIREIIAGVTGTGSGYGTTSLITTSQMGGGTKTQLVGNTFGAQVKANLKENGASMVGSLILIPAGFRVFNKLTRKPRGVANKALKMTGLPLKV
jgi:hypothetical protein